MHTMPRSSAVLTLSVLASALLAGCAGMMPMAAPEVPAAIAVPAGNKVAFMYKGSGLLNYECRVKADAPTEFSWVLASPDAALKDKNDALVGKYYGGPTWEHADGSKVTGKQLAVSPAPTPGNIPWQLVQATPDHRSAGDERRHVHPAHEHQRGCRADRSVHGRDRRCEEAGPLFGGLLLLQGLKLAPR